MLYQKECTVSDNVNTRKVSSLTLSNKKDVAIPVNLVITKVRGKLQNLNIR